VKNGVQLITYPDSLGGNLRELRSALDAHFAGAFAGVHVLPFYPSSGDRGFAPLSYFEVASEFGSWDDIAALGKDRDVLADVMVNHVSSRSEYFRDFLKRGEESAYADFFITLDKVWSDGIAHESDIDKMFLRRSRPYSTYAAENGGERTVWTTFGKSDPSEQVDLDVRSAGVRRMFADAFRHFAKNNVNIVRLDAVGYAIKKPGTSCFFVEPEISEFLDWIAAQAQPLGIALLPEVHSHYSIQRALAEKGFWIYDFILPFLILEALFDKSSGALRCYLKTRPRRQFTMLDCHDGIPVKPDLDGIADSARARRLVDRCLANGANLSRVVSGKHKDSDGFDVHQIRGTYYSMLGCDDDAYMAARAVQFFAPGIPQVYYVGLLAGENDHAAVERTGEGREINRRNYSPGEIAGAMEKEVAQRLLRLIRFRNEHAVFDGEFAVEDCADDEIHLRWRKGALRADLLVNLSTNVSVIEYAGEDGSVVKYVV